MFDSRLNWRLFVGKRTIFLGLTSTAAAYRSALSGIP